MGLIIYRQLISPAFWLIPIETGFYRIRGNYGKNDLENANTKAPRGFRSPFRAFLGFRHPVVHLSSKEERGLDNVGFDY